MSVCIEHYKLILSYISSSYFMLIQITSVVILKCKQLRNKKYRSVTINVTSNYVIELSLTVNL